METAHSEVLQLLRIYLLLEPAQNWARKRLRNFIRLLRRHCLPEKGQGLTLELGLFLWQVHSETQGFCLPMTPTWSSGMLTPVLLCILILGAILTVLWLMGRVCLYPSPTNRSSIRGAATRLRFLSVWMMPWVRFCGLGYFLGAEHWSVAQYFVPGQ